MFSRLAVLATPLAMGAVTPAPAQDAGRHMLAATLSSLGPMRTIRILTSSGATLQGDLSGFPSGPWSVVNRSGETPIRLREVDTLWRRRTEAHRGATIGGTAGAVVGGILGVALLAFRNASEVHGPSRTLEGGLLIVGGGIALGGVAGIGIGALVGSSTLHWDLIYP